MLGSGVVSVILYDYVLEEYRGDERVILAKISIICVVLDLNYIPISFCWN